MKKYTDDELMMLQLTDMNAYLRAVSGLDPEPKEPKAPKKEKKNRDKFPKEFGSDYGDVDAIYLKGRKKKKHDDYDYGYSGNVLLDTEEDDEEDDYDDIAAIYSKGNKKIKKQRKKAKQRDYDFCYGTDFIDEFSDNREVEISSKEITAYKAIRARINILESGGLPMDEYTTLIKLCAVVARMHTTDDDYRDEYEYPSYDYDSDYEEEEDDYDDDEEDEDDESEQEEASAPVTVGGHLGNQYIKIDSVPKKVEKVEPVEVEEVEEEPEEADEDDAIAEAPIESIFYARYDTSFDRLAVNSQYVSLNVQMDAKPIIATGSLAPNCRMFADRAEAHDFVKKWLLPYMCSHMHPSLVVKRQLFETTAKTNYKYDTTKFIFIARGNYVNCYYIDALQYKTLQDGLEFLASTYEDLSEDDIMSNMELAIVDLISELYRDPCSINDAEYTSVCVDDDLTSNDRFSKFWKKFYGEKNDLNALPEPVMIDALDYEELQTAMFLFTTEWKEKDGDNYKDMDAEFAKTKPSEVIANNVILNDGTEDLSEIFDQQEDDEEETDEDDDSVIDSEVVAEPDDPIGSLMDPIPVHR